MPQFFCRSFPGFTLLFFLGSAAPLHAAIEPKNEEFFERRIRPVLVENCYECHSSRDGEAKGGLRLDSRQGWEEGGESGPAIRPGNPERSLLIRAIRQEDGELQMPPPDHAAKLSGDAINDLVQWVRMGAPDPRNGPEPSSKTKGESDAVDHWSFQPPRKTEPPVVKDTEWSWNDIDRFVLARLEERGLGPNSLAMPRGLIRRLSFDLTGLPPSPEDIASFEMAVELDRDAAVQDLVDRLLSSSRFGERWGRHWLDVARYAESSGHERNFTYPHAWRYRDWVIDSLNQDKPYDLFLQEQIAGDLLPYDTREQQVEHTLGTALLAFGPKNHLIGDKDKLDLIDDQIDVVCRSMLGLTVACARCHDHKYDPVTTAEYYSLAGIFASTESLHGTFKGKGAGSNSLSADLFVVSGDAEKAKALQKKGEEQKVSVTEELKRVEKDLNAIAKSNRSSEEEAKAEQFEKEKSKLQDRLTQLEEPLDLDLEYAMAVREGQEPSDVPIRIKGVAGNKGEVVPRGFPAVLTHGEPPEIDPDSSGRLALSEWITRKDNPLTARVIVNRIWGHLFGEGLVSTVDNFGLLGSYPSHPELLDYLAVRFMEEGWSIKSMIRLMVTSRVYQLSSEHDEENYRVDPEAVLLWRMRPRRLEVEPLRDAILAFSGQLEQGPPPMGSVVAEMGDGCLQRQVKTEPLSESRRWRSVYLPVVRFYAPEMNEVFDGAPASFSLGKRAVTTVPGQALFLLNNEFIVEQAEYAAERLLASKKSDEERICFAFELAFGRLPDDTETSQSLEFVTRFPGKDRAAAWKAFSQALFTTAEFRYVY